MYLYDLHVSWGFNLEDSQRCDQKDGLALTGVASVCLKEERLQCLNLRGKPLHHNVNRWLVTLLLFRI